VQPRDLVSVQAVAGAQRVQLGVPERLIGVDIADAGDDFLIQQQRLEARTASEQQLIRALNPASVVTVVPGPFTEQIVTPSCWSTFSGSVFVFRR